MVNGAQRLWLVGACAGAGTLAEELRARGLNVHHAATADALPAAREDAADALVYVAPPAPAAGAQALARHVTDGVSALVAAAQRFMRAVGRGGGSIVVVTDIAGIPGRAGRAAASALSGALIAAAKCLAKELGRQSVAVNAVAFGFMPEMGVDDALRPAEKKLFDLMNLGRPGRVAHLADNVVHLAANRHLLTGQVLHADHGLVI